MIYARPGVRCYICGVSEQELLAEGAYELLKPRMEYGDEEICSSCYADSVYDREPEINTER